jgi:hypothetical protein
MNKSNNVIDLKSRSQRKGPEVARDERHLSGDLVTDLPGSPTPSSSNQASSNAPVLDMTERRNEMLTQERRKVRRTMLSEFIGAHVVVPERGLQRVVIYDISDDGIAFDVELDEGKFAIGEEVGVRVYLNQQTYFPFVIRIANLRMIPEEGVTRHGGIFLKGAVNDVALHHFVKFIETVSASLRTDRGDVMVSGLRK